MGDYGPATPQIHRLLGRVAGITMDEAVDLYEARVARLLIHGEQAEREALQQARRSARIVGLEQEYVRARHDAATAWRSALPEVQGPWLVVGHAIANAAGALVVYSTLDEQQLQALNGPWRVAMGSMQPMGPGVAMVAGTRTR